MLLRAPIQEHRQRPPQSIQEPLSGLKRLQQKKALARNLKTPEVAKKAQSMLKATVVTAVRSLSESKEGIKSVKAKMSAENVVECTNRKKVMVNMEGK